jgi:Sulfotransferase domain.
VLYLRKRASLLPFRRRSPTKKEDIYPSIFKRLPSDVSIIIDASKKTKWAEYFLKNNEFDVKFIHLIRDPRALVLKWMKHYKGSKAELRERIKQVRNFPQNSIEIFSKEIEFTYALKWSQQNREITNFLLKNNLNSKLITYHDLATKPENTIKTITEWLNLQYENTQLNYWAHQHHGTQKPNYDWVKEKKGQFIDLRWKNELAEEAATKIARNKQVVQLISDLKLTLNINGLEN